MTIRNYILVVVLLVLFKSANAQKLSFNDLTTTFELSGEKLDAYMKSKNYIFRSEEISGKKETTRNYWEVSPLPKRFLYFDTYTLSGRKHNYRLRYSTQEQDEFKQIEALLVSQKYKKEKIKDDHYKGGIVTYRGRDYHVELKVIRVGLFDSYMVTIFNDKLGVIMLDIIGDQLLGGL